MPATFGRISMNGNSQVEIQSNANVNNMSQGADRGAELLQALNAIDDEFPQILLVDRQKHALLQDWESL